MPLKRFLLAYLFTVCFLQGLLPAQSAAASEYPIPSQLAPYAITPGPDNALWFTETGPNANGNFQLGRIARDGSITEFEIPPVLVEGSPTPVTPQAIATGRDGALWFTELYFPTIGRMTTSGTVTDFAVPSGSIPTWMTAGPDGNIWFTEVPFFGNSGVGFITPAGQVTEFTLPNASSIPGQIVAGPDGALWFTDTGTGSIGRISTSGVVTEYPLESGAVPAGITPGPDGALWFTDGLDIVGRMTTSGTFVEYHTPASNSNPQGIVAGPDQGIWFVETGASNIGRISLTGSIGEYPTTTENSAPFSIAKGPDQALWFTETLTNNIGRIVPGFGLSCNFTATPQVGASYSASCSAVSGTPPYTYSVSAGSLPPGLTLNASAGMITGTPSTPGTYSFTITATDRSAPVNTASYPVASLVVGLRQPTTISCSLPASGQVGIAFSGSCTGGGGIPPYTYSISAGTLPAGLSLNTSTGAIAGTPTTFGSYSFTVQASDSGVPVQSAVQPFPNYVVLPATLLFSCNLSASGQVGVAYSASCSSSGGVPPYVYSISSGALPPGLTLNGSSGSISGTPSTTGTFTFTLQAKDSGSPVQTATRTIPAFIVLNPSLGISCNFGAPADAGVPYTTTCVATNGKVPYTFSIASGSLPAGLRINASTGVISGTPVSFGTFSFAVRVTDSSSPARTETQDVMAFAVLPKSAAITTTTLPNGAVALPYSGNPRASGGTLPYSWSIAAGQLPAGLTLNSASGAITGVPSAAGAFSFTLSVNDSSSPAQSASQAFSATISGPVSPNFLEYPLPASNGVSSLTLGPDGALWFTTSDETTSGLIERITTAGLITLGDEAPNPLSSTPGGAGITTGADGALWFAETDGDRIGRIVPGGAALDFGLHAATKPQQIALGADGALWFTESGAGKIGRITGAGTVTEYAIPTAGSAPLGITSGPDGALWFTESAGNTIGQLTTAGVMREFALPSAASSPYGITSGPDGALWFTERSASKIGRISTTGQVVEYATLTAASEPVSITAGTDGALWFTELAANIVGRITTGGVITEYPIPTSNSGAQTVTVGPDSAIWLGENTASKIAQFAFVPQLAVNCTPPASVPVGGSYSSTCTARGGIPPYQYSISAGALPPGVSINPASGVISGAPGLPGSFSYTVKAADASSPSQIATRQVVNSIVSPLPLMLTCSAAANVQVGTPYTGTCSAVYGTQPYVYSIAAGFLPPGLTLDPALGLISGTPATPGAFTFTVQVTDKSAPALTAAQVIGIIVKFGTVTNGGGPLFTLNGFPVNQDTDKNISNLSVQLNQAAATPLTAVMALSFAPNTAVVNLPLSGTYIEPSVQFVDGANKPLGNPYSITIPAGATSVALPNIDPGTVAGGITATLTLDDLPEASATFYVQPAAPQIEAGSVQITNVTATSFDVEVVANSNTRDMQYANYSFTVASGAQIVGQTQFTFDISAALNSWFASQDGLNYGSAFSLTVPFKLSGAVGAIQSVSVTLTNSVGISPAVTGGK